MYRKILAVLAFYHKVDIPVQSLAAFLQCFLFNVWKPLYQSFWTITFYWLCLLQIYGDTQNWNSCIEWYIFITIQVGSFLVTFFSKDGLLQSFIFWVGFDYGRGPLFLTGANGVFWGQEPNWFFGGRHQQMGSQRIDHTWAITSAAVQQTCWLGLCIPMR